MKVKHLEHVVHPETGEVLYAEETDVDFYLFTAKGYLLGNNQHAVKLFTAAPWGDITADERAKMMGLLPYIDEHNRIMRLDRRNKPMTTDRIAEALNVSTPRVYSFMKRMVDATLLRKIDGVYWVNPVYTLAGNRLSKEAYEAWRDVLDPNLPDWVKDKYREG